IEERDVRDVELDASRRSGVVVEAERNPDPRRRIFSSPCDRVAPREEPGRPAGAKVPDRSREEDHQKDEDVGTQADGPPRERHESKNITWRGHRPDVAPR